MHRFFIDEEAIEGEVVKVTGSDFNHISHSLRMKKGDQFIVNNGDGLDYIVEIGKISGQMVIGTIIDSEKNKNEPSINVTLAQAVPKKNNMDLIVQKCTEIGIKKIIPIYTERTIVKLSGKKRQKKIDRWRKIAEEAAKQSGRGVIPVIGQLIEFTNLESIFSEYELILIPWEDEQKLALKEILECLYSDNQNNVQNNNFNKSKQNNRDIKTKNILIIIGPEGGFSPDEIQYVEKSGGYAVTLGPRILRTETAGFVALTVLLYQAGELGG